jgi:cytochrome P450
VTAVAPTSFDPFDTAHDRDPWADYAVLRAEAPVWEFQPGVFLVTRYDDVRRCLRNDAALSNRANFFLGDPADFGEPTNITMMDPPRHTGLRKVELSGFSRGPIRDASTWIAQVANGLVDEFADDGHADLSSQFGLRLTTRVIARLVGVPAADADEVVNWAHDITQVRPDPVEQLPSFTNLFSYLTDLVAARRASDTQPDDMITTLMEWSDATGETPAGLPTHIYQLMAAGFPTTAYTFELLMLELLKRDLWGAVSTTPIAAIREEGLRVGSAIRAVFRVATRDIVVGETAIPSGSRMILALESANRDERTFTDPDEFSLTRENATRHLAFGSGIHLCLGSTLARLELDMIVPLLRERLPGLHLPAGFVPQRRAIKILNGLESLPVEW